MKSVLVVFISAAAGIINLCAEASDASYELAHPEIY